MVGRLGEREHTFGKKENSTKSPMSASKLLGVNVRPFCPTATLMRSAVVLDAARARRERVEKCMMMFVTYLRASCERWVELMRSDRRLGMSIYEKSKPLFDC